MIIDEAGLPLQDKYYEVDSTIQLSCIVRDVKMATSVVYWNHSDQILNYDVTRGGIRYVIETLSIPVFTQRMGLLVILCNVRSGNPFFLLPSSHKRDDYIALTRCSICVIC